MRNARTRFLFFRRPLPNPNRFPRRQRTAAVRRSRFWLRYFPTGSAQLDRNGRHIRLSKERQNKLDWTSTDPKHTHFVWDGTRLLQEYTYKGHYTYICANQDSCEPLAPVRNRTNAENENRQQTYYFHCDQISIPKEMTSIHGNLL